jgi:hypothetical protein
MKSSSLALSAMALAFALGITPVSAECVTKGAVATAESEKSAKWYALETMVQAVSWGLWPGFLANGKVEGYRITGERYSCTSGGGGVTCRGRATFCKS